MDPRIKIKDASELYTLKIVSFLDYEIYLDNTIFGGVRLKPYHKDEFFNGIPMVSEKDWCAGDKKEDIIRLLNALLQIIEDDKLDNYPECSKIKPYVKDAEFCKLIFPNNKIFLTINDIEINNKSIL